MKENGKRTDKEKDTQAAGQEDSAQEVQETDADKEKVDPETVTKRVHEVREELKEANVSADTQRLLSLIEQSLKDVPDAYTETNLKHWEKVLSQISEALRDLSDYLKSVYESDTWQQLEDLFPGLDHADFTAAAGVLCVEQDKEISLQEFFTSLTRILPVIPKELEAYKKETGAQEVSFLQFVNGHNPKAGEPAESLYSRCLKKAADKGPAVLKSVVPDRYLIPNSIVSNSLTKGILNRGVVKLDASRNHNGKYKVYAAITLDPNKYAVDGKFTPFDRRVFNGVCSLYAAGNAVFTADMVARAMNGLSESEKISSGQVSAVTKSLNKLRDIDIKIDATEEFKKRHIIDKDADTKITYEAKCLEARKVTVKTGGKEKTAYQPLSKPVLYEYSERINQIISIKPGLLEVKDETGERIRNTDSFTTIREFLLMRIEHMKSDKRRGETPNTTIKIDTFYTDTGTDTSNRTTMNRARKEAAQCLDYWKKQKYIAGYTFTKETPDRKNSPVKSIKIQL